MKIFFVDFLSGFAGIFIPVRQKKSLKISFFMEKGMVCEKQKLAGMTGNLKYRLDFSGIEMQKPSDSNLMRSSGILMSLTTASIITCLTKMRLVIVLQRPHYKVEAVKRHYGNGNNKCLKNQNCPHRSLHSDNKMTRAR